MKVLMNGNINVLLSNPLEMNTLKYPVIWHNDPFSFIQIPNIYPFFGPFSLAVLYSNTFYVNEDKVQFY
jgi:hypothetical protein